MENKPVGAPSNPVSCDEASLCHSITSLGLSARKFFVCFGGTSKQCTVGLGDIPRDSQPSQGPDYLNRKVKNQNASWGRAAKLGNRVGGKQLVVWWFRNQVSLKEQVPA